MSAKPSINSTQEPRQQQSQINDESTNSTSFAPSHLFDDAVYVDRTQHHSIPQSTQQPMITRSSHIHATPTFTLLRQYQATASTLEQHTDSTYQDTTQYLLMQRGETPPLQRTVSNLQMLNTQQLQQHQNQYQHLIQQHQNNQQQPTQPQQTLQQQLQQQQQQQQQQPTQQNNNTNNNLNVNVSSSRQFESTDGNNTQNESHYYDEGSNDILTTQSSLLNVQDPIYTSPTLQKPVYQPFQHDPCVIPDDSTQISSHRSERSQNDTTSQPQHQQQGSQQKLVQRQQQHYSSQQQQQQRQTQQPSVLFKVFHPSPWLLLPSPTSLFPTYHPPIVSFRCSLTGISLSPTPSDFPSSQRREFETVRVTSATDHDMVGALRLSIPIPPNVTGICSESTTTLISPSNDDEQPALTVSLPFPQVGSIIRAELYPRIELRATHISSPPHEQQQQHQSYRNDKQPLAQHIDEFTEDFNSTKSHDEAVLTPNGTNIPSVQSNLPPLSPGSSTVTNDNISNSSAPLSTTPTNNNTSLSNLSNPSNHTLPHSQSQLNPHNNRNDNNPTSQTNITNANSIGNINNNNAMGVWYCPPPIAVSGSFTATDNALTPGYVTPQPCIFTSLTTSPYLRQPTMNDDNVSSGMGVPPMGEDLVVLCDSYNGLVLIGPPRCQIVLSQLLDRIADCRVALHIASHQHKNTPANNHSTPLHNMGLNANLGGNNIALSSSSSNIGANMNTNFGQSDVHSLDMNSSNNNNDNNNNNNNNNNDSHLPSIQESTPIPSRGPSENTDTDVNTTPITSSSDLDSFVTDYNNNTNTPTKLSYQQCTQSSPNSSQINNSSSNLNQSTVSNNLSNEQSTLSASPTLSTTSSHTHIPEYVSFFGNLTLLHKLFMTLFAYCTAHGIICLDASCIHGLAKLPMNSHVLLMTLLPSNIPPLLMRLPMPKAPSSSSSTTNTTNTTQTPAQQTTLSTTASSPASSTSSISASATGPFSTPTQQQQQQPDPEPNQNTIGKVVTVGYRGDNSIIPVHSCAITLQLAFPLKLKKQSTQVVSVLETTEKQRNIIHQRRIERSMGDDIDLDGNMHTSSGRYDPADPNAITNTTTTMQNPTIPRLSTSPCDLFIRTMFLLQPNVTLLPSLLDRTPTWLPDDASPHCLLCLKAFSFFNRKHHCRACGKLVCHPCSTHTAVLPDLGYPKSVRVCTVCYEQISGYRLGSNLLRSLNQLAESAQQDRISPGSTATTLGITTTNPSTSSPSKDNNKNVERDGTEGVEYRNSKFTLKDDAKKDDTSNAQTVHSLTFTEKISTSSSKDKNSTQTVPYQNPRFAVGLNDNNNSSDNNNNNNNITNNKPNSKTNASSHHSSSDKKNKSKPLSTTAKTTTASLAEIPQSPNSVRAAKERSEMFLRTLSHLDANPYDIDYSDSDDSDNELLISKATSIIKADEDDEDGDNNEQQNIAYERSNDHSTNDNAVVVDPTKLVLNGSKISDGSTETQDVRGYIQVGGVVLAKVLSEHKSYTTSQCSDSIDEDSTTTSSYSTSNCDDTNDDEDNHDDDENDNSELSNETSRNTLSNQYSNKPPTDETLDQLVLNKKHSESQNFEILMASTTPRIQFGPTSISHHQPDILVEAIDDIATTPVHQNHIPIPSPVKKAKRNSSAADDASSRRSSSRNTKKPPTTLLQESKSSSGHEPRPYVAVMDAESDEAKALEQRAVAIELSKLALKSPKVTTYYDYYGFQSPLPPKIIETVNKALQDSQSRLLHEINKKNRQGKLTLNEIAQVRLEFSIKHQLAQEFAQKRATRIELAQYAAMDQRWKDILCEMPFIDRNNPKLREGTSLGIPPNVRVFLWKSLLDCNVLQQHYDSLCLKQLNEIQQAHQRDEWERLLAIDQANDAQTQQLILSQRHHQHELLLHDNTTGDNKNINDSPSPQRMNNTRSLSGDSNGGAGAVEQHHPDQKHQDFLRNLEFSATPQQSQNINLTQHNPTISNNMNLSNHNIPSLHINTNVAMSNLSTTSSLFDSTCSAESNLQLLDQYDSHHMGTPLAHSPLMSHVTPHAKLFYRKQLQQRTNQGEAVIPPPVYPSNGMSVAQTAQKSNESNTNIISDNNSITGEGATPLATTTASPMFLPGENPSLTPLNGANSSALTNQLKDLGKSPQLDQSLSTNSTTLNHHQLSATNKNNNNNNSGIVAPNSPTLSSRTKASQNPSTGRPNPRGLTRAQREEKVKKSCLWIEDAIKHVKNPLSHYANLLGNLADSCQWVWDIEKDINRTLPTNKYLDKDALRRVLAAYSVHNRRVGYCQSMNHIAAAMLLVLHDEEDAFWSTTCIVEGVLHMRLMQSTLTTFTPEQLQSDVIQPILDDPLLSSSYNAYPQTKGEFDQQQQQPQQQTQQIPPATPEREHRDPKVFPDMSSSPKLTMGNQNNQSTTKQSTMFRASSTRPNFGGNAGFARGAGGDPSGLDPQAPTIGSAITQSLQRPLQGQHSSLYHNTNANGGVHGLPLMNSSRATAQQYNDNNNNQYNLDNDDFDDEIDPNLVHPHRSHLTATNPKIPSPDKTTQGFRSESGPYTEVSFDTTNNNGKPSLSTNNTSSITLQSNQLNNSTSNNNISTNNYVTPRKNTLLSQTMLNYQRRQQRLGSSDSIANSNTLTQSQQFGPDGEFLGSLDDLDGEDSIVNNNDNNNNNQSSPGLNQSSQFQYYNGVQNDHSMIDMNKKPSENMALVTAHQQSSSSLQQNGGVKVTINTTLSQQQTPNGSGTTTPNQSGQFNTYIRTVFNNLLDKKTVPSTNQLPQQPQQPQKYQQQMAVAEKQQLYGTNQYWNNKEDPKQQQQQQQQQRRINTHVHLLYHQDDLMGARVDTTVLSLLIKSKLPRVHKVFIQHNVDPQTITFSWLLSFFQDIIPLPTGFAIIDWLLLDGCRSLFRLALIILRLREPQILQAKHHGDIILAMSAKIVDVIELNRYMCEFSSFSNVSTSFLQTLRQQVYENLSGQ